MKKTWISVAIIVVLVGITLFFNLSKSNNSDFDMDVSGIEVKPAKGFVAPKFSISDVDGNKVTLTDLRGKPVFINFWASWCPPCKEEMPYIEEAYKKHNDRITFLMINAIEADTFEDMTAYMQEYQYSFPVQLDKKNLVSDLYQVFGYPTSYFIDKRGVITDKVQGGMSKPMFDQLIDKLLKD